MKFAVIPARGGSKRIPEKNIKLFSGEPLISYPIKAAQRSGLFDKIIVSTDSPEVAKVARDCGAEVPFTRPQELSTDFTPIQDVLKHALSFMDSQGFKSDFFCCIYPTSPLICQKELAKAFTTLQTSQKAAEVYSVTSFPYPIFRALQFNEEGFVRMFWPEHELTRSNDLPEAFHDAGQMYWFRTDEFKLSPRLIHPRALPHILPRFMVQDIDTKEDWLTAELLYETAKAKGLLE